MNIYEVGMSFPAYASCSIWAACKKERSDACGGPPETDEETKTEPTPPLEKIKTTGVLWPIEWKSRFNNGRRREKDL
jgi:hypothetical protein